ncbi:hypothetical protein [Streptomyces marincola]|uniref:hypothetical protein n=1 Tax=Streptomyces marincola TaxID=2878388 RepID=UPI0021F2E248|nr:hypothetical protein [Streptomyces marincola]
MATALLPRLADGTAALFARLGPPAGLVALGLLVFSDGGAGTAAVGWTAALVALALGVRLLVPSVPRVGKPEAAETAAAAALSVAGLLWAAPSLAAWVAVPLAVGTLTAWHAAGLHTRGAAAAHEVMVHVQRGIVHTARSLPVVRATGRTGIVRLQQLSTVDRFHDVFFAMTRRMVPRAWLTEATFSPVTLLAVVLVAGAALGTPEERVLACALFAPVAGVCAAKLSESARGAPGTPDAQRRAAGSRRGDGLVLARARAVTGPLTSGSLGRMTASAGVTVLAEAAALVLAAVALGRLLTEGADAAEPWLRALLPVAAGYLGSLWWTLATYQSAGVGIARLLSHRFLDRVLALPDAPGDDARVDALARVGTADVVTTSGLFVHHLRSMVGAALTPPAAVLALAVLDWRVAVAALCLVPSMVPAVLTLRTDARALRHRPVVSGLAQGAGALVVCAGAALLLADVDDPAALLAPLALGVWFAEPVGRTARACRGMRVPLRSAERLMAFLNEPGGPGGSEPAEAERRHPSPGEHLSTYDMDIPRNRHDGKK